MKQKNKIAVGLGGLGALLIIDYVTLNIASGFIGLVFIIMGFIVALDGISKKV